MNPSTGMSVLSQALHAMPSANDSGTPLSKRERLGTAATSLKRLVQDEWEKAGSRHEQQLPLPLLRTHSARSSMSARGPPSQPPPRFAAPPPQAASAFPQSRYAPPPGLPETCDMGDTPLVEEKGKGKGRQSIDQEEEDAALNAALEASLREEQPAQREPPQVDTELREVLEQSRDEEMERQQQVDAQEQTDLNAALLASSATQSHTLYQARSQTLPVFTAADLAASAYPPEKAREFPQGRPALPPGAGSAWDDEQREMELLAEAIRLSKKEEDQRLRMEAAVVDEALRRSELGGTSGEESAGTATTDSTEGTSEYAAGTSTTMPGSPGSQQGRKERRRSWLRPPLSSKLATASPPSSPPLGGAPLPPPRPLPTNRFDSDVTVATYRTAQEGPPFSNLDAVSQGPPPRPARPPPPLPPSSASAGDPHPRLLPPPPKTPVVGSSARAGGAPAPLAPNELDHPQHAEAYRLENNGSPYELPFLTPSSSLRSISHAQHLRPGLATAAQWDSRSGGSYDPLSTSSHSGDRSRRVSSTSGPGGSGEDSRSASSQQSDDSGPPLSPLSIRNPDGTIARPASVSSASTADGDDEGPPESLWIEDLPGFPGGLPGVSAYAGRSMSAIDEMTEPASSILATDDHEQSPVRGEGGFHEASLAPVHDSPLGLPDEPSVAREAAWLAGRDGSGTPRLTMVQRDSAPRTPSFPPGAAPPMPLSHSAAAVAPSASAAAAHDMHEDGLRFGYPAPCALELAHACPADGLDSSTVVPAKVELSSENAQGESRNAWAIEAHSWVALVRALMWHGDTTIAASAADLAQSRSARCAATATLEFRPDDEGLPVLRLVLALVPPQEALSQLAAHNELSVSHPPAHAQNNKGKSRARPLTAPFASFALPDLLHLPTRLSSLAIQLYTLRHLAGIARATQPARSPAPSADGLDAGYPALRELADAISALARAAQDRERGHDAPPAREPPRALVPAPATAAAASTSRPRAPPPEEQNARLVTRLRDRLRRLKRRSPAQPPGAGVASSGSSAASGEVTDRHGAGEGGSGSGAGQQQANKLVKPMPPPRATAVLRSQRVLAAEDVQQDVRAGGAAGGGKERGTEEQREMRYLPVL